MGSASATYTPDALASLRESYSLQLDATRSPKTSRIYLAALDSFLGHLRASAMPTTAGALRREAGDQWGDPAAASDADLGGHDG